MVIDQIDAAERLARIEQLMEKYRAAKHRRLLQRAMRLWRKAEAGQQIVGSRRPHSGSTDHIPASTNEKNATWFVVVTLVLVANVAFGAAITAGTAPLLLALSVVPPIIMLMLWPGPQPATAAEVLYGADRRG